MDRRIAQGRPPADRAALVAGVAVLFGALAVYLVSNPDRDNAYNHFVWQASAWLHGHASILYPVYQGSGLGASNDYFQDVLPVLDANGMPTGRALLPFPPLPALLLLPFVALWGLATNAQLVASIGGALDVGLAYWVLGRLAIRPSVRLGATVFFAFGTVFWYAAMEGTTWYLAHVVAVGLTFAAIGLVLGGEDHDRRTPLDGRRFLAGLLLGLAATARLTMALGLPFLIFAGGGSRIRNGVSAALGMALPAGALLAYNLATTGHLFHPAYEAVWRAEVTWYPALYPYLGYHVDWGLEDVRYIPQHLGLMLAGLPQILPPCDPLSGGRALWNPSCPIAIPRDDGVGLLVTSPAYLLALPALRSVRRDGLVAGVVLAVGAIAAVNLAHFSQGWVQFGYRFANDFAPFLVVLVALGMERLGGLRWYAVLLIAASIAVNWWGVVWGVRLGW